MEVLFVKVFLCGGIKVGIIAACGGNSCDCEWLFKISDKTHRGESRLAKSKCQHFVLGTFQENEVQSSMRVFQLIQIQKNQFFVSCRFEQSIQSCIDSCVHCHAVTNICNEIGIQSFHMVTGAMLLQLCFFLHFSQKLFFVHPS